MTTEKKQSDIAEVRDQLSLDFADTEYLNVVSQNLGMDRPVFGFSDDTWRALVKALALEYKQIATKFAEVLEILVGPQVTEVGTLAEPILVGDTSFVLNDSSNLPQLGTLVFDEGGGLLLEETKVYCYIDRKTNTVYLEDSFGAAHVAMDSDAEGAILALSPLDEVVLLNTDNFPVVYPYPVVLGRGTAEEEVVQVTHNSLEDVPPRPVLTLSGAPTNSHSTVTASSVADQLAQRYFVTSAFLLLEDTTKFPSEGIIRLEATGTTFTVTGAGSGPTDRSFDLAASTLVAAGIIGYEIVFDIATTTVALQGVARRVVVNTTTEVTVDVDFSGPGTSPQVGDTFALFPIVSYSSVDYDTHTVTLTKPIVQTPLDIPLNSTVELMNSGSTAALSPVKFAGAGWEVIQSTPRLVELLLPEEIRDINDIRSASYMHDDRLSVISTTNSVQVNGGDTIVISTDFSAFPDAGTVEFDPGGGSAERLPYGKIIDSLGLTAAAGDTFITLSKSDNFPTTGTVIVNEGTATEETLTVTANDTSTEVLTLSGPLTYNHKVGEIIKSKTQIDLETAAFNTHTIGTTIDFFRPLYVTLPIGDFNQAPDTFPGPYVYDPLSPAATATSAVTSPAVLIPGIELLAIDQSSGRFSIEVADALVMLEGLGVIFTLTLGTGTASKEDLEVVGVALKNRAITTLAANSNIGDTIIEITALAPGSAATGGAFPTSSGYRIVIDEATSSREVAYVLSTLTGPDRLVLETPLTIAHTSTESVALMADVLSVTAITKPHDGFVVITDRSTALGGSSAYFLEKRVGFAELINPHVDSITLTSVVGLDITGGRVLVNFGYGQLVVESTLSAPVSAGGPTCALVTSDDFPSPTSHFAAILGVGTPNEEIILVTANNTGTDVFTFATPYGPQYAHATGELVRWVPGGQEVIEYSEIDTNDLVFARSIVLQYSHYPAESVIDSSANSDPRTNGYDFPLRMPVDILVRLQYLLDIVRAAGVQVELITKR